MLDDPRLRLGSMPISGPDPAGENARYDPAFDALEAEVAKMDTLGLAGVDWSAVASAALMITETKSKDLLVASYATLALYRTEAYAGLAIGLTVLADMAEAHWDGLMPPLKRERARVQALEWVAERVGPALAEHPPQERDGEAVIAAYQAVEKLSDTLDARLQKTEASLGTLLRPLRDYAREAERVREAEAARLAAAAAEAERAAAQAGEAAESGADATPAGTASAPPAGTDPSANGKSGANGSPGANGPATATGGAAGPADRGPAASGSAADGAAANGSVANGAAGKGAAPIGAPAAVAPAVPSAASVPGAGAGAAEMAKGLRALRSNMLAFAKALRAADASDPRSYALTRSAGALMLRDLPETRDGRMVDVSPPNPDDVLGLEAAVTAGNAERVLAIGEDLAANAPLWLSLHRTVAETLDTLGPKYVAARAVVAGGALSLASRFEGLSDLAFADGTPAADDRTRTWLREFGGGGEDMVSPIEQALGEARVLAAQGEVSRAGALLAEARGVGGRADAFEWQIARARFCLEAKEPRAAIAILEALEGAFATAHAAQDWDSRLVVRATALLLRAYESAPQAEDDTERAERIAALRARLCALDLGVAMNFLRQQ